MIVAVLGAGALGILMAASLADACEVRLLVRDAVAASAIARRGGVQIVDVAPKPISVRYDPAAIASVDVLVIGVKAFATVEALAPFRDLIEARTAIISLQNGIEAVGHIDAALGARTRVALAPTTEAATRLGHGLVRRAARGTTRVGWAAGRDGTDILEEFVACANRAGLAMQWTQPIEPCVWSKLVVNAAINPVTALAGVANGVVLERVELRKRAAAIAREAAAVARAAGIVLPFSDPVAEAEGVMRVTATNRSSMLQDFERGGPTEIDAITGAIVRLGALYGIAVPENVRVLDEVRRRMRA